MTKATKSVYRAVLFVELVSTTLIAVVCWWLSKKANPGERILGSALGSRTTGASADQLEWRQRSVSRLSDFD